MVEGVGVVVILAPRRFVYGLDHGALIQQPHPDLSQLHAYPRLYLDSRVLVRVSG